MSPMLSHEGPALEDLPPGYRLGPYEVVRTLGAGGFGVVYEARHAMTGGRVALKVLHAQHYRDPSLRERFLREARAAAEVRHPHVVEVYEVGEVDQTACIAMSFLEGPTLADTIERHGAMSLPDALDVLLPIFSAVQTAHDAGIVHRDLKPDNIILARVGDRVHPTLLDFGVAKLTTERVAMTQTNMVFGTPHYMSPEQARDTKSASAQSDVWSLGVILFECVTGALPWPGDSLVDVQLKIMERAEVSARASIPSLPAGIDEVIMGALRRDAQARFASVRDFAQALLPFARASTRAAWSVAFATSITEPEALTPKRPLPPPPRPPPSPVSKPTPAGPSPRRRAALVAGGALTLAVVGAAALAALRGNPAPVAMPLAPASPAPAPSVAARPSEAPSAVAPPVAARVEVPTPVAARAPARDAATERPRRPAEAPRRPVRRPRTEVPIL